MNQAADQPVNEIQEMVQPAWLGISLRGLGQICEPGGAAGATAAHPPWSLPLDLGPEPSSRGLRVPGTC